MTRHIKSIVFTKDFTTSTDEVLFKKGERIDLIDGINLIVGDQGTGKSTLLNQIFKVSRQQQSVIDVEIGEGSFDMLYFDTESMNPRQSRNADPMLCAVSKFMSHGQAMWETTSIIDDSKNLLIVIDEPESGLSIKSQYKLLHKMHEAVKRNCQFILATHSNAIMSNIKKVFCLERKEWLSAEDFLAAQYCEFARSLHKMRT